MASYFLGYVVLLIVDFICQGRNLRAEALKIDGLEERVLAAGSNFLLSCQANETITWRYPSSTGSMAEFSQITKETPSGFTAILTVQSSDYLATGFYDCIGDTEEASVYVYVFDEDHLLAINPFDIFLIGRQYEDIVVPCKPTSPDVNVSLTYQDNAARVQGIEKFGASYTPYVGYVLSGIDSDGFYTFRCVGHINNLTSDYFFSLQVLDRCGYWPEFTAVYKVTVDPTKALHADANPIKWPKHFRKNATRTVEFSKYDPKLGFTISNVTLLDSDVLICTGAKGGNEDNHEFVITINTESETAPQPEIQDTAIQHFVVGQDVTLHCFAKVSLGLTVVMDWILPETANLTGRYTVSNNTSYRRPEDDSGDTYWEVSLTLSRVVKEDEGNYTCRLRDYSNNTNSDTKYLKIYSKDDSFINITVRSKSITVDASLGETAKWVISVTAHPNVELHWYGPDDQEIPRSMAMSDKYQIRETRSQTILEILDVQLQDAGNYTLIASNSGGKEVVILELIVLDRPIVSFDYSRYYRINVPTKVSCFVEGYPTPNIHWNFRRCNFTQESLLCSKFQTLSAVSENITELQITDSHIVSTIIWSMQEPGELSCTAQNSKGNTTEILTVLVTDVPEGFLMGKTSGEIVEGDNLTLACAVTAYEYWDNLSWAVESEGSQPTAVNKNLVVEETRNYSYWSKIQIQNVTVSHSGNYTCKAYGKVNSTVREETIPIRISRVEAPEIIETNLPNEEVMISSWQPITWKCTAKGVPSPSIYWLKDDDVLVIEDDFPNFELLENNSTLSIKSLTMEEEGKYTCKAKNKGGEVEAFVYLKLKESHKTNTTLVISVVVVAILLIIVLVSFFYALWKMAKEKEELRMAGLQNFKKGMTKSINQGLTLDQQTDLLPYDPKWEFPSSKLKLGEQLGAGAFGVVLKASAYGIVEEGEWTTVAVKMVKPHADPAYIRALVSELKILAHLGKHLNVVNLLGACTKNYMKKELLVVVEYCTKGNAHNYILRHRHRFIDQIDPVTGEIDINKRTVENYNRIRINYATLTFPRSADSDPNSELTSLNTEMTCLSSERMGGDSLNGGTDWYGSARDYKKYDLDELSTSTLICWSFQVARGMEYLASRRVLHGDLAARNVLIADNNIVKICDFGFAKNIYSHPEYQKTGDGPVPVKWMAIESITRRIFSTQSDVWSFGIVLWEFFSLAKTPYPGFENFESILKKLEGGYRMEKPAYANQTLYDIMLECWDQQPCRRPSFSELAMKLGKLLESNVREHYIQLNEPFRKQVIPEEEDYLSMMSPPDYDPPTSHYVNEPTGKQNESSDGYLCMRPSSWSPVTDKDGNPEDSIEMKPMLPDQDKNEENLNDDYLVPRQKPATSDCAFNPTYIMSRTVSNKSPHYGKINKP